MGVMTARQAFTAFPARIDRQWDDDIVAQLVDYIRLPAKSPHFDPDWKKHGHIDAAVEQARRWVEAQALEGLKLEVIRLGERTPVLFFDVPARGDLRGCRTGTRHPSPRPCANRRCGRGAGARCGTMRPPRRPRHPNARPR